MKTCTRCNETKTLDAFYTDKRSKDGLKAACKSCMDLGAIESRKKHYVKYKQTKKQYRQKTVEKYQEWKKEKGCLVCGETFPYCLELHHLDPTEKEETPSQLVNFSFERIMKEAEKCVVVCSNCHRKIHYGLIDLKL